MDVKKKKKENIIYQLAKINGYKKMFSDDKEKSTKVPHSGYNKFKGNGEFEYHLGCDIGRDQQKAVIRISVCDNILEKLLIGKHKPPWKAVITATYMDATYLNNYQKGSTVGIQHLVNPTPVNWDCEQHATVITATNRSKFKATENAKEQIMNTRYKMREWGVPISVPHKVLGGTGIKFFEFDSKQKLLDIMSQHCGPLDEWPYVQPLQHIKTLLFWHGGP